MKFYARKEVGAVEFDSLTEALDYASKNDVWCIAFRLPNDEVVELDLLSNGDWVLDVAALKFTVNQ